MGWIRSGVVAMFLLAGCVEKASLDCGSGMFECPSGTTCDVGRHRCLRDGELAACQGKADGEACTFMDVTGACYDGLCESSTCGDGKIGPGEVCDDGDLDSGDGCRGDCRSNETCGNGLIDHEAGEECDCGDPSIGTPGLGCADFNSLTSDVATCLPTTCKYRCGDGVVEPGELCDTMLQEGQNCLEFGYDTGELSCSAVCAPSFAKCEQFGWPPVATSVPDAHLHAVWGADANNVFAVGDLGVIVHYDGTTWSKMMTPGPFPHLFGVWGRSATDVYAVGENGFAAHYDGSAWTVMLTGYENLTPTAHFRAITGNATRLFVAGGSFPGTDLKGFVAEYASGTWTSTFPASTSGMLLTIVLDPARNEITTAGEGGAVYRHPIGTSTWTPKSIGIPVQFTGSAVLGTDVYLVGQQGLFKSPPGGSFSEVGAFGSLNAIWGTSPTSFFVLGDRAYYYDGVRWLGASEGFVPNGAAWGTGTGDVWAVGNGIRHFAGTTWSDLPATPTSKALLAIATGGAGSFAGTADGSVMRFQTDVASGVGKWVVETQPTGSNNCPEDLSSPIQSISIGSDIVVALSQSGVIAFALSANYDTFICENHGPAQSVFGVYASDSGHDITAVGGFGSIFQRRAGTTNNWVAMTVNFGANPPSPKPVLRSVFGFSSTNMFAVGDNGTIARWTGGSEWTVTTPTVGSLNDVWGISDQDMFAVGTNGTILHFNGTSWTPMTSGTVNTLETVWGRSATDVYAAGGDTLLHYDGTKWQAVRSATLSSIHDLGGTANWLFGVGDDGAVEMLLDF